MDLQQWAKATQQLLQHMQRSGIDRLPCPQATLPSEVRAWLEGLERVAEPDASSGSSSTASNASIAQSQQTSAATAAISTATITAGRVAEPPATRFDTVVTEAGATWKARAPQHEFGPWNEPSLSTVERQTALDSLDTSVRACRKCTDIVCRRQRTVFGIGPLHPKLVMFGDVPGADEDRKGEPFVGAAGQLLDKILKAAGLGRHEVYLMNSLKCRPPGDRTPTEIEIENCRPFYESQLEILQPEYIVCWGSVAVRAILGTTDSIGRLRGRFHAYKQAKVLVMYHPVYLLRNPEAKRSTWEDMKLLMRTLGIPIPGESASSAT